MTFTCGEWIGDLYSKFQTIFKDDPTSRRICKSMVELDRVLHAAEGGKGYETWMFSLEPKSCTPKNDILIGAKKAEDVIRFKQFLT